MLKTFEVEGSFVFFDHEFVDERLDDKLKVVFDYLFDVNALADAHGRPWRAEPASLPEPSFMSRAALANTSDVS